MSCGTPDISNFKTLSEQKTFLRKRAKAFMQEFITDKELALQAKKSAAQAFLKSEEYKNAGKILGFMAMNDEIDVSPVLEKALQDGKTVYLPRMKNDSGEMDFFRISSLEKDFTCDNKYKIREPLPSLPVIKPEELTCLDVILVPGVAFNLEGQRLGRGKGFYDRYISRLNCENRPKLCGVCSVICITKAIPADENDKPVDFLLNEYGFVECKHA